MMDRRTLIAAWALAPLGARASLASSTMTVFKDPDCGCCGAWVDHVRKAGFVVEVRLERQMARSKSRVPVPADLVSCHTALVGGYAVEGHVPAEAIVRLVRERPPLIGIAVPGMPIGSPGMEVPGQSPEPFSVIGFAAGGKRLVFAEYARGFAG